MAVTDTTTKPASTSSSQNPLIVDLGKKRRRDVRRLRKGRGKLYDKVTNTLQELRTAGTISSSAESVVVIVREKRARPKRKGLLPRC
jgi:hypothetical protein